MAKPLLARPLVSVIIPTYGRVWFLKEAVASIRAQEGGLEFEVIVVDNTPSGALHEYVGGMAAEPGPPVRYLAEPRPGLTAARHAGARGAQGEILAYVDDDILAAPGWLAALLPPYSDPGVACVGGRILPQWEVEPPPWLADFPGTFYSLLDYGEALRVLSPSEYLWGCNFSIRKQTLFQAGGFHPDYFADRKLVWHGGDGECGLLRKVQGAGYKVVYAPQAVVRHRISAERLTSAYLRRRAFDFGIEAGYSYFRYQSPSWTGLTVWIVKSLARVAYHQWRQTFARGQGKAQLELQEAVAAAYYRGRLGHAFRLLCQPGLRRHCSRETYLD